MTWERKPLWDKATLYMERAMAQDREQETFGLWAAMALELLTRSAVSKISPTLLAEPDRDQKNILHALGLGSGGVPKSIVTAQVLALCRTLIPSFTEDEVKAASALIGRRNEELHTGSAAFLSFPTQSWLPGFYRCCKVLAESQGESLNSLLGTDEAKVAENILQETEKNLLDKIRSLIAAHTKVFDGKDQLERERLAAESEQQGVILSHQKHHRVKCPACKCTATVQGDVYGGEQVEHGDEKIIVRQNVVPMRFMCSACGLKLSGYGELLAAGLADHFTHRTEFSPGDYYELVDPLDEDMMQAYAENHGYYQFSND